ncbi:MAG: hypothetical protein HYX80_04465 [Chloroflexi bacterium]|nr:hypothetical protein [Chloroflexota bacterium]
MFDFREVSWFVALIRIVLAVVILVGGLAALDVIIYLNAANGSFDDRVAAAFRDAYDYGYAQTFDATYQEARDEGFDKGYSKGYEISKKSAAGEPVSRLVETHNPTYSELMAFLAEDKTDGKPYIEGEYVCFEYAAELNNNADVRGLQAAYVRLRSDDWGHAVVAFETVDKGLIFIEPQSDSVVNLVVGQPYPWQQVGATSPLTATDPILEIELIW